jgi:hypothetical protein
MLVPQFVLSVNVIYKTELKISHLSAQNCFYQMENYLIVMYHVT